MASVPAPESTPMVSLASSRNVAPDAILTAVLSAMAAPLSSTKVPAETDVAPELVLVPAKVRLPVSVLVRVPVPLTLPLTIKLLPPVTLIFVSVDNAILPDTVLVPRL